MSMKAIMIFLKWVQILPNGNSDSAFDLINIVFSPQQQM